MYRTARIAIAGLAILLIGITGSSAAAPPSPVSKQQIAQKILASKASNYITASARIYLEQVARNDRRMAPDSTGVSQAAVPTTSRPATPSAAAVASLPNVRVN